MKNILRFGIALILSISVSVAFSQATNSGDIRGTVTDQSGAVVPDVTVTVLNVDTNITRTYTTNDAGLYDTGSIVPDHYTLTFSKPGFATYVRGPITLQVGLLGLNAHLTVGSGTQRIVVTTNAPLLNTTTAEQSTTLSASTMEQLPQVGASWQNFAILLPGTSGTPQGGGVVTPPVEGLSANGSLPFSTVLLDGASNSMPQSDDLGNAMPFDAISEVKISDSLFSAQYGTGGLIYNQISKGGSSQFHGEGYEYFQNNALNAAPYSFGTNAPVPILHYNEFGGNIGGPILNKRLFFFFNYDKIIDNGGAANGFITVPDAAMREGDFTGQNTIYDPTTQTVDAAGVVHRQSFASEYGNGNTLPSNLIDSVAKAVQAYYPAPNTPATIVNGIPTNNYFYNVPSQNGFQKFFGRLDFDVASNNRLTISEAWGDNPAPVLNQGLCPIYCASYSQEDSNAQVSDVWAISPNTMNEARFGFSDELTYYTPDTLNEGYPAKLGWRFAKADNFPTINIGGEYSLSPYTNAAYKQFVFEPSDVATIIRGRHILQFGGEFLINRLDSTAWGNINGGTMNYAGVYTASTQGTDNTTGSPYADFLLGQTQSWSALVEPEFGGRLKSPQLFIQDDIKARPNLTINLGLRWMGQTGWSAVNGDASSFDPTVLNPATNTLGAAWYGVTHANGRTSLQKPVWTTFMPRVGFSYQPLFDTTLRGGFGVYTYPWSADTVAPGLGGAISSSGNETDSTNGVYPVVLLDSDGNTNYQGSAGASVNSRYQSAPLGPASYNEQYINYTQYRAGVPTLYQWNLALQRQLGADLAVQIAYVASHGTNQGFQTDLNQVPEDKLAPDDASGPTNARPYPNFQSLEGYESVGVSNYNSLQASIQKRMSSGLEFNFNYTWSKFLDDQDTSGQGGYQGNQLWQSGYIPSANYGPSNFDIRNAFKGHVVYQLPIGKGRRFLSNNRSLDEVIGGWLASGTVVAQSGNPFTVIMADNNSYSQAGDQYPNVVGNPRLAHRSTAEWFNVAAFAAPPAATFGDSSRNSVYGPGLTDVNFSLGKLFPMWQQAVMQIQGEATNVLNHPSFAQPDPYIGPGHIGQITAVTVGGRAFQLVGRITF